MEQNTQGNESENAKSRTIIRRRMPSEGGKGSMPRVMWLAILVCVVGATLLFRGSSQKAPTSTGERRTVVTAPTQPAADVPRSGEVDLTEQTQNLTPEQPAGKTAADKETVPANSFAETTTPPVKTAATTAPPAAKTAVPKTAVTSVTPPLIQPAPDGQYAVQTGAFGTSENADAEAARLMKLGWDARVRAGNSSSGDMVYRVWICYFASRQVASDFIRQESKTIPGAIVVHR